MYHGRHMLLKRHGRTTVPHNTNISQTKASRHTPVVEARRMIKILLLYNPLGEWVSVWYIFGIRLPLLINIPDIVCMCCWLLKCWSTHEVHKIPQFNVTMINYHIDLQFAHLITPFMSLVISAIYVTRSVIKVIDRRQACVWPKDNSINKFNA